MPKIVSYPRCELRDAIEVAQTVYDLGETATLGLIADKIGMSEKGGAFSSKISSTAKYGLIRRKGDTVSVTGLARDIFTAYNEPEREALMMNAFLNVPLFREVYQRFSKSSIDLDIFEKMLVREYSVDKKLASRVSKYFIKSAEMIGLLNKDGSFTSIPVLSEDPSTPDDLAREPTEPVSTSPAPHQYASSPSVTSCLDSELFEILMIAGSLYPDFVEDRASRMQEILDSQDRLSHTSLVFSLVKGEIESEGLSESSANILIEALRKDLKISDVNRGDTDSDDEYPDELGEEVEDSIQDEK